MNRNRWAFIRRNFWILFLILVCAIESTRRLYLFGGNGESLLYGIVAFLLVDKLE